MTTLNSMLPAWRALREHADETRDQHLRDLVDADGRRFRRFHVEYADWLLDLSRQRIHAETLVLLYDLARAVELPARIAAMFRGDAINVTEGRAVLHTALRSSFAGSAAIQIEVQASRERLRRFVAAVRARE